MMKREGIVYGMSHAEYRSGEEVSNSRLSDLAMSPAHCYALNLDPNRPARVETDAMLEGNIAHTLILEPDTFASRYIVKPDGMSFATKEGKAWRDACPPGLTIVKHDQMVDAKAQEKALLAHPTIGPWLHPNAGQSEVSVFWTDERTGLRCKARPDRLVFPDPDDARAVIACDVKRIADNLPEGFSRAASKMGFHRQRAHYIRGLEANGFRVLDFVFLTVPSCYPFLAIPYVLDPDSSQLGLDENRELLDAYADFMERGEWPAHPPGVQMASLPRWAFPREEDIEVRDAE